MKYSSFLFADSGTPRTHIIAWDPTSGRWLVPCRLIRASGDIVTHAPTKPLCRICEAQTRQVTEKVDETK